MYIEIISPALCAVATGFSYYFYREAKWVSDLAVRAADIARLQCKDAAMYDTDCKDALQEAIVAKGQAKSYAEVAGIKAGLATLNASVSNDHSKTAEGYSIVASGHAATSAEHAGRSEAYSTTAQANAEEAKAHAAMSMEHRMAAHDYSIDAATHAAKTDAHASSVGALSRSIADIAAQTKVRLVHRTDYSTDGSNIGGR